MQEVVESVKKVTSLIAEITAASTEQAQGIEQVSETMTQLEKVTQQNAAMVEEASAAAGSLEEQSRTLSSAVAAFRLGQEPAHSAPAPKPLAQPRKIEAHPAEAPAAPRKPAPEKTLAASPKKVETYSHSPKAGKRKGNGHAEEGWQEF
jgi:methyl-accepting chemotaxis protein